MIILKVLIVDDEQGMRLGAEKVLKNYTCDIIAKKIREEYYKLLNKQSR